LLIGNNHDEFGIERAMPGVFGPLVASLVAGGGPVEEAYIVSEAVAFTCPAGASALARSENNVPVWRYRFMPAFPNLVLRPGIGAYHGIELPSVFGTNQLPENAPLDTLEQEKLSKIMRHAWAEFIKDPVDGLKRLGWPRYDPKGSTLIRLGYENTSKVDFGKSTEYDGICEGIEPLDGTLGLIPTQ
jgi:carboxylesterase type B